MPAIDDLTAVRRLLDAPGPRDDVVAAGRNRLDELIRHEAGGPRHLPRLALGAVAACAVAVAATVAATVVVPRAAHPGGRPAAAAATRPGDQRPGPGRPGPGTVQQAILTAAGAVSGDIMYINVTYSGVPKDVSPATQFWLWPARAAVGQQVHLVMAARGLRTEMTFTQPAHFPPQVIATTYVSVNPAAKTWTSYSGIPVPGIPLESSLALLDKQYMLENFVNTSKVISAHATVDGQQAIEVSYPGANGILHFLLWVNAQTYLPLRMDKLHFLNENSNSVQRHDFQFLPPTPANLAKVAVTIPPGYKRAAG